MLKTLVLGLVIIVVVLSGSMAFQSGNTPTLDPSKIEASDYQIGLAQHMFKNRAVMYGSYKCPHCLDQKELFGDAFPYIYYVECHPKGPEANPSLCFAKGIRNFPTWEINGQFYQGAKTLEQLSQITGYDGAQ